MDAHNTKYFDGDLDCKVEVSWNAVQPRDKDFLFIGITHHDNDVSTALSREDTVALRDHINFLLGEDEPTEAESADDETEASPMQRVADDMDTLYEALRDKGWSLSASRDAVYAFFSNRA